MATYPNVGYAHQGWLTEDQRYFYMNDEGDESNAGVRLTATRTLIWDVSDLEDPMLVKEHMGETFTIDHNLYIKDDLMYQSNYVSGLRILDISDRRIPSRSPSSIPCRTTRASSSTARGATTRTSRAARSS
jgi:choice-of-anchor B domain-containing protein